MSERIPPPKPGIYPGVPFEEYCKWDAANNTTLGIIDNQSPAHAKVYLDDPPASSDAFKVGQAFHKMNLEPFDFGNHFVVIPKFDRRTKQGKEDYAKCLSDSQDKTILSSDDYGLCKAMSASIAKHTVAAGYLKNGKPEICIVWEDPLTGVTCKARLDYVHIDYNMILDLKSTRDASPKGFSKAIANYGYHRQAAFYMDGLSTLQGGLSSFVFVAVEKVLPFGAACYQADENLIGAGRNAYRRALSLYAECRDLDIWYGYSKNVEMISVPDWLLYQEGINTRSQL